jgi:hypothetical protein
MGRAGQDEASQVGKPRPQALVEAAKKRLHRNVLAIALANKLEREEGPLLAQSGPRPKLRRRLSAMKILMHRSNYLLYSIT